MRDRLCIYGQSTQVIPRITPGATLTEMQAKLTAAGWPIHYLSKPEQVVELLSKP